MNRAFVSFRPSRFLFGLAVLALVAVLVWWQGRSPGPRSAPATSTPAPRVERIAAAARPPVLEAANEPAPPAPIVELAPDPPAVEPVEPVEPAPREPEHASLDGMFLDDTRKPIANATCTAGIEDERGALPRTFSARTDAGGMFHFAQLPLGEIFVTCGRDGIRGRIRTALTSSGAASIEIVASAARDARRGHAGMTLEDTADAVHISALDERGPAATAGLAIGDTIVSVDGQDARAGRSRFLLRWIETRSRDKPVQVGVVRGDRELQFSLTLTP